MTPARLSEIKCPACAGTHWIIESDFKALFLVGGVDVPYSKREYDCGHCSFRGPGFEVIQQSPPEFLLQPHHMYPMSARDFAHWVGILRRHFPRHPHLWRLGTRFYPHGPILGRPMALSLLLWQVLSFRWLDAA
jgi:hypothetical protein